MLNKEKYHDEIFEIACERGSIAVKNGKPVPCQVIACRECDLIAKQEWADCHASRKIWCNSEYEEPPVDWAKVKKNTPVVVSDTDPECKKDTAHRHFAGIDEKGRIMTYTDGYTSWVVSGITVGWKYARLATPEELRLYEWEDENGD